MLAFDRARRGDRRARIFREDSMLELWLMRHAHSEAGREVNDRERPLSVRGEASAARMGAHFCEHGFSPARILCSSAARARDTCAGMGPGFSDHPHVDFEPNLYLASPETLLQEIERVDRAVRSLLLVGHLPGLEDLALALAGQGPARLAAQSGLAAGFEPAAAACFESDAESFAAIRSHPARLVGFASPTRLAAEDIR